MIVSSGFRRTNWSKGIRQNVRRKEIETMATLANLKFNDS